jgi:hypothetical protein
MRAKDTLNNYSNWTSSNGFTTATFATPTITAPLSSATGVNIYPTVTWSVSTGGSGTYTYEIMIDDDSGYGSPTVNQTGKVGTNYVVTDALSPYTLYYIKMRAKDDLNNYSAWTSSNSFTTASFTSPTFTMPTSGISITTVTPTFSWSASTGGDANYTYELQVSLSNTFATNVVDVTGIATTSYVMTSNLTPDTHYARLRAKDGLNNYSSWTSTVTFSAVAESSGGSSSSSSSSVMETYQPLTLPTTNNDDTTVTTTTTSGGSVNNIINQYIMNPARTIVINPLKLLWDWFVGILPHSAQEELESSLDSTEGETGRITKDISDTWGGFWNDLSALMSRGFDIDIPYVGLFKLQLWMPCVFGLAGLVFLGLSGGGKKKKSGFINIKKQTRQVNRTVNKWKNGKF